MKLRFPTLFIIIVIVILHLSSCKEKPKIKELPKIEYDVLINNFGNNYSWFDHVEGFQRLDFFNLLLAEVKTGKFTIESSDGNPLNINAIDSMMLIHIATDTVDSLVQINSELLNGLRFREKWLINEQTGMIEKDVIAICPLYFHKHPLIDQSDSYEVYSLFWIYPSEKADNNEEMIITSHIAYDVFIDNSQPIIKDSYGEKPAFYFSNIEQSLRSEIVNIIVDAGFEKRSPVYDFFMTPMPEKYLEYMKGDRGTVNDTTQSSVLNRTDVVRIKFLEEWSLNTSTLKFTKRLISVSPYVLSYDEFGEFRGYRFLFWLVFDQEKVKTLVFE